MAKTQIRGAATTGDSQIKDETINNLQIALAAAIASTKLAAWSANRDANSNKLVNLANGTSSNDAVNLGQLNAAILALTTGGAKTVRLKTTANVTLSGTQTIDGVAGAADDRIFVGAQTAPAENGPYLMKSGAWVRTTDSDTWPELVGSLITVEEGTTQHDSLWLITADLGGTLGTTAVTYIQLPGPSDILAGTGLTRSGQTINAVATDASITVNADDFQVHLDSAGAIALSASGIAVALGAATGLQITSNTVGIKLNGASLTLGVSGLSVTNPCPSFAVRETPSGTIAGGTAFTLAHTPVAGTEEVFLNGILQEPGGEDYTISGTGITFVGALISGDRLRVSYHY